MKKTAIVVAWLVWPEIVAILICSFALVFVIKIARGLIKEMKNA